VGNGQKATPEKKKKTTAKGAIWKERLSLRRGAPENTIMVAKEGADTGKCELGLHKNRRAGADTDPEDVVGHKKKPKLQKRASGKRVHGPKKERGRRVPIGERASLGLSTKEGNAKETDPRRGPRGLLSGPDGEAPIARPVQVK